VTELRLGLIGAGRWGRRYIHTLNAVSGMRLVRLASSNPESNSIVGEDCIVSPEWHDVATDSTLDGLIIATPPALHAQMTETALNAGLHVLVEKPMTLTTKDARRLVEASRANRKMVFVGHTHLFSNSFRTLKGMGSRLGTLREIRSSAGNWGPYRPDTSVLWDWAPHDLAMCLDLIGGDPTVVSAQQVRTTMLPDGPGESIAITLEFGDLTRARINVSNIDHEKSRRFEARFDDGTLVYNDLAPCKLCLVTAANAMSQELPVGNSLPLDNLLNEFATEIRSGSTSHTSLGLGVRVVELITECQHTLERGGTMATAKES
jgi:predicted dehydrogenase